METNAAEGALSNYAAMLKTMDATFTFISATAFFSEPEKSHPGHNGAAEPDGAYIAFHILAGDAPLSFLLFNVPSITTSAS